MVISLCFVKVPSLPISIRIFYNLVQPIRCLIALLPHFTFTLGTDHETFVFLHRFLFYQEVVPILIIRLELIQNNITFRPPLDGSTSIDSVNEVANTWINSFLNRAEYVEMLGRAKVCIASELFVWIYVLSNLEHTNFTLRIVFFFSSGIQYYRSYIMSILINLLVCITIDHLYFNYSGHL